MQRLSAENLSGKSRVEKFSKSITCFEILSITSKASLFAAESRIEILLSKISGGGNIAKQF